MTVNNCDSQSALRRQEIYLTKWLVLCVMVCAMYNIAFYRKQTCLLKS